MNNWVEIATERLAANYRALGAAAGSDTEVLAVVKANAYGHGAVECSRVLVEAGARWLGVTCAAEGARVREGLCPAGADTQILVMCGFLPQDVTTLREYHLTPVVWTLEQVGWLGSAGEMAVHVEVDTGMGRQGVVPGEALAKLLSTLGDAGLRLDGIFTHFCSSEIAGSELTQRQERLFDAALAQVAAAGLRPAWVHAGNSSTVDNPAQAWPWLPRLAASVGARAMLRAGLALYGYTLPIEGPADAKIRPALEPVMTWKAAVLAVRELAAGETIGYNATFMAQRPMRVALLGVGYADGLRRELSSAGPAPRGWVMLRGARAGILGRISMNLTVVDATAIDGVRAGDVAVLLGEGVTAEDHARLAGTIAYEIVCGVHPCS